MQLVRSEVVSLLDYSPRSNLRSLQRGANSYIATFGKGNNVTRECHASSVCRSNACYPQDLAIELRYDLLCPKFSDPIKVTEDRHVTLHLYLESSVPELVTVNLSRVASRHAILHVDLVDDSVPRKIRNIWLIAEACES